MEIKGERVGLHIRRKTGTDEFNRPIFTDSIEIIDDVVIAPGGSADAVDSANITGMEERCTLYIPKGDAHKWENTKVDFHGKTWRTIGRPQSYQQALLPLRWDKVVQVTRHE